MEPIIKIKNLCFHYTDQETNKKSEVLNNISLDIRNGEFLVVLGHNGSGKSTLAKHLNAILTPTSGKVLIDDIDTSDSSKLYEIRRRVGMVFQNPDNQMVANIVEEDVAFAPENLGIAQGEIEKRVTSALKAVNMLDFRSHAPHMLSGGQKQRIAIAGVLAMHPDILVLDEPTAMLDPAGRKEILDTITQLNKEHNITVVLITHYMDEAVSADRVVVIDHGQIQMEGKPSQVFKQVEQLKSMGLDTPQATELIYMLKKSFPELNSEIIDPQACIDELNKYYKNNRIGDIP